MLFHLLYHYLGYKTNREEIKNIISIDNNIAAATTKLNNLILEHDTYKQTYNDDATINLDNSSLHHAQDHLNAFNNSNQDKQKTATTDALGES